MSKHNINDNEFTEGTKLKLEIFRECFREWYPVFVHAASAKKLYVYDLFAGSGTDSKGVEGSPLILIDESRGDKKQFCHCLCNNPKTVVFTFNDADKNKTTELKEKVDKFYSQCKATCIEKRCPFEINCRSRDFSNLMFCDETINVLKNKDIAKFVLLDQYGFKEITECVFSLLTASPRTDFIFFIASSFVKRFKDSQVVAKYFKENKLRFDTSKPNECHKVIAKYYKSLIPKGKKYYIHHFTIQKGANYYGLIFGTAHSLGMEKFIKVCWAKDEFAGESNCNVYNDYNSGTLFYNPQTSKKRLYVSDQIKTNILNGSIKNNRDGLEFALMRGCEPKLFVEVVKSLKEEGLISIDGVFNTQSQKIHKVKIYNIKCNENDKN